MGELKEGPLRYNNLVSWYGWLRSRSSSHVRMVCTWLQRTPATLAC